MVKEILIWFYLTAHKLLNIFFRVFSVQNKITFIISFENNADYVYRELVNLNSTSKIVLLYKSPVTEDLPKHRNTTIIPLKKRHLMNWIFSVYHISTSRFIIIDNYYAFLSVMDFKENVECIQIWHAAGAFKTFGLKDKSIKNRSKRANRRFRNVYSKFNKIVVGSEEMADIFKKSFGVTSNNILRTGVPRTDFFYDEKGKEEIKDNLYKIYPGLKNKKVILYAPTYRDGLLKNDQIHLNVTRMYEELRDDYILLIKTHPVVESNNNDESRFPGFVYNFSSFKNVNHLLVVVDYLITDYSSIPFEYALLQKPMIFFPYDYEKYKEERGVITDYKNMVPGPVVFDTAEVIKTIIENRFNTDLISDFSNKWNEYSTGSSSKQLVTYLQNKMNH